jgi:hypothetical protein
VKYLFIAPAAYAWGELTLGLRAAEELRRRGHRILFLVASSQIDRPRTCRFESIPLRTEEPRLEQTVERVVAKRKIDSIVLVDATTWLWAVMQQSASRPRFLEQLGVPIFALDIWGVRERGFAWDLGSELLRPDRDALDTCELIQPAPFLRPRADSYGALPELSRTTQKERRQARTRLGIGAREKLIIFPTASWQRDHPAQRAHSIRSARYLPVLIAAYLARAGKHVRLLHVGPAEQPSLSRVLGDRYLFAGQLEPQELERRMRAADLMLSFNLAATTIGTAIALQLPVLVGINSLRADREKRAVARLSRPPSNVLSRWIEKAVPIERFSVWPVGFHRLMERALRDNPLAAAVRTAEVLDEHGFVEQIRLFASDREVRREIREAQASYATLVTALPSAADILSQR